MDFFKDKKLRKHLFQSFGELLFLGIGGILLGVFFTYALFYEPYVTSSTGMIILVAIMALVSIGGGILFSYATLKELTVMQSLIIIFIVFSIYTYFFLAIKYDWKWV